MAAAALAAPTAAAAAASRTPDVKTVDFQGRCRVTVLRRECYLDLQGRYLDEPEAGPCPLFATGQTFELDSREARKLTEEGKFCPKAWECIAGHVKAVAAGQSPCDAAGPGPAIACCNDGTRPVVFKIEKI